MKKNISGFKPLLCQPSGIPRPTRTAALKKTRRAPVRKGGHDGTDNSMTSLTAAARTVLFAIALMHATPLFAQGTNYEGPVGVTGIFNGNVTSGCSYDPLTHSAHRAIDDIVVPGSVGKYPLKMTRYYNSRQQYYAGGAIALSPGWAHEYSWIQGSAGRLVSPHGNVYDPFCGSPVGVSESWESNDWRLADGGRVHFDSVTGRCTWIEDPYRQRTTITYSSNQISQVTEPGGRYLKFFYGPAADPDGTVLLTRVEAHGLGDATVTDSVSYSYTLVSAGVTGRNKRMLTGAAYGDGTSATYAYTIDNVPESATSHKMYPLVQRCDDVRYNGPMHTIRYEYQSGGPHGAIINEKNPSVGAVSSIAPGVLVGGAGSIDNFTETRGDGPTRSFTYSHIHRCQGTECGPCDDVGTNGPNQQMLLSYTDFRGNTTTLGYDANWYINSVTDANNHTTSYQRGPDIGQITQIMHPDGTHVDYTYDNESPNISGHYMHSVSNERQKKTTYTRDPITHLVTQIDYPDSAYETFTYNSFGQVLKHRLKNGAYQHFQYDLRGLLTAKWEPTLNSNPVPGDPKISYTYYTSGPWTDRVLTMTLPVNVLGYSSLETYEYDRNPSNVAVAGRGLVTKITHADSKYQSFGYDAYGNKLWEENELRQRITYTYDDYNRALTIQDPLNQIITNTYTPTNGTGTSPYLHTTNSIYTTTTPTGIVTKHIYDANFRKTSTTQASGTLNFTTSFHYDAVGNQDYVTDPRGTGSGDVNYTTYTDFDSRNRKWQVREPLNHTTQFYYDDGINVTRIIRPDQTTETKTYDAMNRVLTDTVPQTATVNLTTSFVYNPSAASKR